LTDPFLRAFKLGTMLFLSLGATMRRRDFIKVVAGSGVAWPIAVYAQAMALIRFIIARSPASETRSWNEA
jgi:hypothetical protein